MNDTLDWIRQNDFLSGGGDMGNRIRSFDWSRTHLGAVQKWPQSLTSALSICINSNFPIAIYWGPELVLLYNDAWSPIPGNKHPAALGKPAKDVWPEIWKDIGPLFQEAFEKRVATGSKDALLPMERHGYVEECYFDFTFTPIYGEKGRVEGIFNAVIETTYRVISERRAAVLQQLAMGISSLNAISEVISTATDVLEKAKDDIPFFSIYSMEPGGAPKLISCASTYDEKTLTKSWPFEEVVKSGSNVVIADLHSYMSVVPIGTWQKVPTEGLVLPLKKNDGQVNGFMIAAISAGRKFDKEYQSFFQSIASSISSECNTLASLHEERRRAEALAEIDKAKTLFFSNISHEFRTPLTLMISPLEELLNEEELLSDSARENVRISHRNTLRLQKLVNTLLDFSRLEAGRLQAHFTKVDICAFTQDLVSSFRSAIEKAGMTLVVNHDVRDAFVFVDLDMWEKIVLNLVSNAFKYSHNGSITVSLKENGDGIDLTVADMGIGIPENEMEKIFDRFHRVRNIMGRSQEGTGIGLAMVKELVKLHNGTIHVDSKINEGSTFTVTIPRGNGRLFPNQFSELKPSLSQSRAYIEEALLWTTNPVDQPSVPNTTRFELGLAKKTSTVLLADDNADMRSYIQRLLSPYFEVIAVADGEAAYKAALEKKPDLILSDIMMPGLDGFGLLRKLKTTLVTRNIPIIFLSARAGEEAKVEGLAAGADDYVTKPFSAKELLARVSNHLAIANVRRNTEKEFFNLFVQSPVHIHVFKGPDHVLEFFHPLGIVFTGRDITGMPIREALPQLEGQGFFEMLDKVYTEGITIQQNNSKAVFMDKNGTAQEHYFDITYLPWKDVEGRIQGVLQFTFEVTETVEQRLRAEASEKKFRNVAQQAPVAMALLMGPQFIVEVANDRVLELWGKNHDEIIGQPILKMFPEIVSQGFREILENVFTTGKPFIGNEIPVLFQRNGQEKEIFINLLYEPFRNEKQEIEGIMAIGTDVTEQVNARNKVAEAELKFRTIIEQTPSPLCIFKGSEMVLEVANDAALAVWRAGKEVLGKTLVEIAPEITGQPFLTLLKDVYHFGVTKYGYEVPRYFIRKNGERDERYFNFIYVPYREFDQSISGVLVLATDVTEQVNAKKQLVENEERLRIATEVLELGTWEYDPVKDLIFCSDKTIELFGFEPGISPTLRDTIKHIVDEDQQRVHDALTWALNPASGGKYDIEYTVVDKPRNRLTILRANGQVFFDADNNPNRFIGTVLDISVRRKAEEKIKASEARFRLLATSIPQIVWTTDSDGNTNYISGQFEMLTGQSPGQSLKTWRDLVHPDDRPNLFTIREAAVKNKTGWHEEFRLYNTRTKKYRWFQGNSQPLRDPDGKVTMWIGSASDIQDLKEQSVWLEQQVLERTKALHDLNRSLKLSNEDLQQFAHVASHDLKEPLRKIKTFSNRLQDDYKEVLPDQGRHYLSKILSATDRMYSMIDGVLTYSTMASVNQPNEPVDLNKILQQIQQDLEVLIQEKQATINGGHLPVLDGAPVLIYQLFYNLIYNSIKFSRMGIPPIITLEASEEKNDINTYAKIVLSDNGIGFEQEQAERIFTTFTRLNSKDKFEGTGLGLALCKKIVHRYGGFISAKGELDKGAEFTVLLPIHV